MADREVARAHITLTAREKELLDAFRKIEGLQDRMARKDRERNRDTVKQYQQSTKSVAEFRGELDKAQKTVDRLSKAKKISPEVSDKSMRDLRQLEAMADKLSERDIEVSAKLVGKYRTDLELLERGIKKVDGQEIHLPVNTEVPQAMASLSVLDSMVHKLAGKTINMNVDIDTTAGAKLGKVTTDVEALGGAIKKVTGFTRGLNIGIAYIALKIPLMMVAIGELIPVVNELAAGLIELVAPLQSVIGELGGLIGSIGQATGILPAFLAGIIGLATNIAPLVLSIKSLVTATGPLAKKFVEMERSGKKDAAAMKALGEEYDKLTAAQKKFLPMQIRAAQEIEKFQNALAGPASKVWRNVLTIAFGTLNNLLLTIKKNMGGMVDLTGALEKRIGSTKFQDFLKNMVNLGGYIIRRLTPALSGLLNSFRAIFEGSIPNAHRLTEAIAGMVERFNKFIAASERSGKLQEFFDRAWRSAKLLGDSIANLTGALFTFFSGGRREGDNMLRDLREITQHFQDWMEQVSRSGDLQEFFHTARREFNQLMDMFWQLGRVLVIIFKAALPEGENFVKTLTGLFKDWGDFLESARGQNELRKFFREARPAIEALGGLIAALAEAFWKINESVGPSFVDFVNKISNEVIPAMTESIEGTTHALGPGFMDLLIELAKVLSVILGANGPVRLFIAAMTELLRIFNQMPDLVQLVVVQMLGFHTLSKIFGWSLLPALAGGFAKLSKWVWSVAKGTRAAAVAQGMYNAAASGGAFVVTPGARAAQAGRPVAEQFPRVTTYPIVAPGGPAAKGVVGGFKAGRAAAIGGEGAAVAVGASRGTRAASLLGKALGPVTKSVTAFSKALGIAGLIITGIIGFIEALQTNFLGLRDMFEAFGDAISSAFENMAGDLEHFLDALSGGKGAEILRSIGDAIKWVVDNIGPALSYLSKFIGYLAGLSILATLYVLFAPIILALKTVTLLFRLAGDAINLFVGLAKKIPGAVSAIPGLLKNVGEALWNGIKWGIDKVVEGITRLPGLVAEGLKRLPYVIGYAIGAAIKYFFLFLEKAPIIVGQAVARVVSELWNLGKRGVRAVVSFVGDVVDWFRKLPGRLWTLAKKAVQGIINFFVSSKGGGRKAGASIANSIWEGIKKLPSTLWNLAKRAVKALFNALWNGAKDVGRAMAHIADAIWDWIKSVPGKIYDAAKGLGKEIGEGIKDGLDDALGETKILGIPLDWSVSDLFKAEGGPIPGTGRGDKVRTRLEPGEYVIKRSKVEQYGRPFFDAINYGRSKIRPAIAGMMQGGGAAGGVPIGPGLRRLTGVVGTLDETIEGELKNIDALVKSVFKSYEETVKKHTKRATDAAIKQAERLRERTKKKLEEAREAAKKQTEKMAEESTGNFKKISSGGKFHFTKLEQTIDKHSKGSKKKVTEAAGRMARKWIENLGGMSQITDEQFQHILNQTRKILKAYGVDFPAILLLRGGKGGPRMNPSAAGEGSRPGGPTINPSGAGEAARGGRAMSLLAAGGRVVGDMLGTLRDAVPALLGRDEVVLNRHQEGMLEAITGMPGILDFVLSAVRTPNYAPFAKGGRGDTKLAWRGLSASGLNSGIRKAAAAVMGAFPGLSATSTVRPGDTDSHHGFGEAVDLGGGTDVMHQASAWIKRSGLYRQLAEGIHNPNLSVEGGKLVPSSYWGSSTWAGHADHIHMAVTHAIKQILGGVYAGGPVPKVKLRGISGKGAAADLARAASRKVAGAANRLIAKKAGAGADVSDISGPIPKIFSEVAKRLSAPFKATLALFEAGIVESGMRNLSGGDASSSGVLQLLASTAQGLGVNPRDVPAVAKLFLTRGFWGKGGAIKLARNRGLTAGNIAQLVQGSAYPERYDQVKGEALALMRKYGWRRGSGVAQRAGKYALGGRVGKLLPFATGTGATTYLPTRPQRNVAQKAKDRMQKELEQIIRSIEQQFKGQFEQLGLTLISLIRSITEKEIRALLREFQRIQKQIKRNFKDAFQDLVKFTGKSLEFTKENLRGMAQVVAAIKTFRGIAHRKPPTMAEVRKEYVGGLEDKELAAFQRKSKKEQQNILKKELQEAREEFKKMREAAQNALKGARASLRNIVDTVISSSTAIFEAFREYLAAGEGLSAATTTAPRGTFEALQGLDKIPIDKLNGLLKSFGYYARVIQDFGRQFLFAKQGVNLAIKELRDLGNQMKLIQKLARKTGTDFKNQIETVKRNILAVAQTGIDAANRMYEVGKEELDRQLTESTDAYEKARTAEIESVEKGRDEKLKALEEEHEAKLKKLEDNEEAITRALEREQRRREIALTRRQLGKLLAQEFLTEEDISQIESLQEQLAEQLRSGAEAERRYTYEDTIEKINENYDKTREAIETGAEQQIDAINKHYDEAIEVAQEKYAEALITLTNQTNEMIDNIVKKAAKALGVKPAKVWDWLLGGGTIQKQVGKDAAKTLVEGLLDNPNLFIDAGYSAMQRFLQGAQAAAAGQPPPHVPTGGGNKPKTGVGKGHKAKQLGGPIPGVGGAGLYELHGGEYVMPSHAVNRWGEDFFSRLSVSAPISQLPFAFSTPSSNGARGGGRPEILHNFNVRVQAEGLSPQAELELVRRTSLEIARQARLEGATAVAQTGRYPI